MRFRWTAGVDRIEVWTLLSWDVDESSVHVGAPLQSRLGPGSSILGGRLNSDGMSDARCQWGAVFSSRMISMSDSAAFLGSSQVKLLWGTLITMARFVKTGKAP